MVQTVRGGPLVVGVLLLVLAACGTADTGPSGDSDPSTNVDEQAPDGDPATAEEVLAAIAAMDLTEEERVAYLRERAIEEGGVLHYSDTIIDTNEAWAAGFSAAYPEIDHSFVRVPNVDLVERVLAEARAGRVVADVIQMSNSVGAVIQSEGLLARHHGVPVPEDYPDRFVDDYALLAYRSGNVIVWNTDLVADEDAPRELEDLLEPQHSGCVFTGSPTPVAAWIVTYGYEETEAWFEAFLANGGIAQAGSTSGFLRQLAAGEFACLLGGHTHATEALIADGAPLEWHAPDPTPAVVGNIYIHRDTTRPHAAALFVHWMLSREGGAQVVADEGRFSPYPDVPLAYERLQPLADPESEVGRRLRHLSVEEMLEVDRSALELIERYVDAEP